MHGKLSKKSAGLLTFHRPRLSQRVCRLPACCAWSPQICWLRLSPPELKICAWPDHMLKWPILQCDSVFLTITETETMTSYWRQTSCLFKRVTYNDGHNSLLSGHNDTVIAIPSDQRGRHPTSNIHWTWHECHFLPSKIAKWRMLNRQVLHSLGNLLFGLYTLQLYILYLYYRLRTDLSIGRITENKEKQGHIRFGPCNLTDCMILGPWKKNQYHDQKTWPKHLEVKLRED